MGSPGFGEGLYRTVLPGQGSGVAQGLEKIAPEAVCAGSRTRFSSYRLMAGERGASGRRRCSFLPAGMERTMIRDVLVHLDGSPDDELRLAHAEAIATAHEAHVTGLFTNL